MPWITVNGEPPKPTTFEDLGYVQVVRCKDCKHYDKDPYCKGFGDCTGACDNLVKVHDDWFCADGERKEGQKVQK